MKELTEKIKSIGLGLGFNDVKITDTDLSAYIPYYRQWIARGFAANMDYMVYHGNKRLSPADLVPGTRRVIVTRLDYLPPQSLRFEGKRASKSDGRAVIARYTLGRDYHKVLKKKLKNYQLAIEELLGQKQETMRGFVDSAPLLEKPLAEKAGIGWQGKNGLIVSATGSWFFLGSLVTNLELEIDEPVSNKCEKCQACLKICPTKAIIGPKQVDTHKCIAYLTIEHKGVIPVSLRPLFGQRIFGCDDCQMICPWNRWAKTTVEKDFFARRGLDKADLKQFAFLTQESFQQLFAGSAVLRVGYEGFLRNVAIALGNGEISKDYYAALNVLAEHPSPLVREHASWALLHQGRKRKLIENQGKNKGSQ